MQSETVTLAHTTLSGEWHHSEARQRLIVLCHGYQGSAEDPTVMAIASGLNKRGHDTFAFNFSPNAGGFDVRHQVGDIAQIVDRFDEYREVILLAGSFGALAAAIAAIHLPKIRGLITLNGFFGGRRLGKEHRRNYLKFRIAG